MKSAWREPPASNPDGLESRARILQLLPHHRSQLPSLSRSVLGHQLKAISMAHMINPSDCVIAEKAKALLSSKTTLVQMSVIQLVLPPSVLVFMSSSCRRRVDGVNSRICHKRRDHNGTVTSFRRRWWWCLPQIYLIFRKRENVGYLRFR